MKRDNFEVTKRLIYNPIPLAALIESLAAPYLRPVENNEIVQTEISNTSDGKGVLVNFKKGKGRPEVPTRGISMIEAYIDRKLLAKSKWAELPVPTMKDIWSGYITQEYEYTDEVYDLINNLFHELNQELNDFIGNDVWFMFFLNKRFNDFIIERSIDFRVHWYNENHKKVIT